MITAPAVLHSFLLAHCSPTLCHNCCHWLIIPHLPHGWRKKGIIHRGVGVYLRCPVSTSVHFNLRNEGSSEYIRVCEGRESLSPNFQTFSDPRHQFHVIGRLVLETLYLLATCTCTSTYACTRNWFFKNLFLHSLKVEKFGLWRTMSLCYVTLSLAPSGLNLCQTVKTVQKT